MSLTYARGQQKEEYNILLGDHEALIEKHRKLMQNTENLVNKIRNAERAQLHAENRLKKAEAYLDTAKNRSKFLEDKEENLIPPSKELITLENKYNQLVGKVRQAKSKIITLNSNTPYRPGAVERTLKDITEGLKNV